MGLESPYDVVVVGAGPVGLVLACELAEHGVKTLVLEEREALSSHPKANTHSARSLEYYRRLGFAAQLREGGLPSDRPTDVAYFTRLASHELGRVALPTPRASLTASRDGDDRWPTPEPQLRVSQLVLEPLLFERARSHGCVDIRRGWTVTGVEQDAAGAVVTTHPVSGNAALEHVTCRYIVGCDGGRSFVRRAAGIRYAGEGGLELEFMGGRMMATYFRAPGLLDAIGAAPAWQYWSLNPDGRTVMIAIDGRQDFLLHAQLRSGETSEAFDFAACLRQALGVEVACEVLSAAPWRAGRALVAERFRSGRIFIAGDACHLFTPTGGFGVNTGIEDAVNLAWKLAAACQGWAGEALLDTYHTERHAVAVRNTGFALRLARAVGACPVPSWIEDDSPEGAQARDAAGRHIASFARDEFDTPGVQLGVRYDHSAAIAREEGAAVPPDLPGIYVPSAVPGGRAPHLWLADGTSLLDRLGHHFTLLCFRGVDAKARALARAAAARDMPLRLVEIADEAARRIYGRRFVLVRPDQHVAWRGDDLPDADMLFDRMALGGNELAPA